MEAYMRSFARGDLGRSESMGAKIIGTVGSAAVVAAVGVDSAVRYAIAYPLIRFGSF